MKSCPSTGLLVVWYLLTPPFQGGNLNLATPLLQWDQSAPFSSMNDCKDDRNRQLQGASEESQRITSEYLENPDQYVRDINQFSVVKQSVNGSQCISSDDPRIQVAKPPASKAHAHRRRHKKKAHKMPATGFEGD
jgi:hypothetical protein